MLKSQITPSVAAAIIACTMLLPVPANAQKVLNISPGQPCTPGYNCNVAPQPYPQPFPQPYPQPYPPPGIVQPLPQPYPQPYPQPQPFPQPVQGAGKSQQHIAYCLSKYKSYQPQTNTYTAYSGETKYCNSPYG